MNVITDSTELAEQFAAYGFVAFRRFLESEQLRDLVADVDRFIDEIVPRLSPEQVFYEDKSDPATLKQIQQMGLHARGVSHWITWTKKTVAFGPPRRMAAEFRDEE